MLWHTRLGYPYFQVLHNAIPSLNVPHHTSQLGLISCVQCLHGKMHRSPFPKSYFQAFAQFKLFHSDLWGLAPVTSVNGYQYYVLFVDHFTRSTWLFLLKAKFDAFPVFTQFKAFFET